MCVNIEDVAVFIEHFAHQLVYRRRGELTHHVLLTGLAMRSNQKNASWLIGFTLVS